MTSENNEQTPKTRVASAQVFRRQLRKRPIRVALLAIALVVLVVPFSYIWSHEDYRIGTGVYEYYDIDYTYSQHLNDTIPYTRMYFSSGQTYRLINITATAPVHIVFQNWDNDSISSFVNVTSLVVTNYEDSISVSIVRLNYIDVNVTVDYSKDWRMELRKTVYILNEEMYYQRISIMFPVIAGLIFGFVATDDRW